MPVKLGKRGDKFAVVEPDGSVVKLHNTRGAALAQVQAININEQRKKGRDIPLKRFVK